MIMLKLSGIKQVKEDMGTNTVTIEKVKGTEMKYSFWIRKQSSTHSVLQEWWTIADQDPTLPPCGAPASPLPWKNTVVWTNEKRSKYDGELSPKNIPKWSWMCWVGRCRFHSLPADCDTTWPMPFWRLEKKKQQGTSRAKYGH